MKRIIMGVGERKILSKIILFQNYSLKKNENTNKKNYFTVKKKGTNIEFCHFSFFPLLKKNAQWYKIRKA